MRVRRVQQQQYCIPHISLLLLSSHTILLFLDTRTLRCTALRQLLHSFFPCTCLSLVYVAVICKHLSSFPSLSCIPEDIYNGNEVHQVGTGGNSRWGENMLGFLFHFSSFSWYAGRGEISEEGEERGECRGEREMIT